MNFLSELLPRKVRLSLYLLAALASTIYSAWELSNGDVKVFIGGVIAALVNLLAAGNLTPEEETV